jgi:nanoRNase/pAp phosphatase (c-di-AMP/oligoRNAs hydrolase)
VTGRTQALLSLLRGRRRLLILTHTNPDPDSLASALGLQLLARERADVESSIGLRGRIMRAENKEMVRVLGIQLMPVEGLDLDSFDCLALVDTQPGFGHTLLPEGRVIDIVLDHHVPVEGEVQLEGVAFVDIRASVGATSSLVATYLLNAGVTITTDVATALVYGIKTDTADLSRNVSDVDQRAYEQLLPKVDRTKLATITRPALPREYFSTLLQALTNIRIFGSAVLCSLGKVSNPEMVAEVADLLVRMEGKHAVFCGGLVDHTYYVSVRTQVGGHHAWYLLRDALGGEGSFGGHGSVAGGSVPLPDSEPRTLKRLERRLEKNILKSMGADGVTVSGLLS